MRPIIQYQGPFFQGLCGVVGRLGYENSLILWQIGAISWLLLLTLFASTTRFKWLFTAILLGGILLLRLPGLGLMEQNVDESQWVVSAATLVADPHFWQAVDGTTSGPLNVWPPALLYYLGFSLDYSTIRLWSILIYNLPTIWLLLATFRQQFGEKMARWAVLPTVVCLALVNDPDAVAYNSEQLPMLLLAFIGYLLSRIFFRPPTNTGPVLGQIVLLGFVLGCLPYTKLQATPVGLLIAGWVLAGLVARKRQGWRGQVGGLILGGLLPTLLIGIYLWLNHLLEYAFRSYILTNLEYAQSGSWQAGTISWGDRLLVRLPQIYGSMLSTNWFWWLALGLGLIALVDGYVRSRKIYRRNYKMWFVLSVCAVAFYATLQPGNPFAHYQWLSFVPVSWLIGLSTNQLLGLYQPTAKAKRVYTQWNWAIAGAYLLGAIAYPGWVALNRPNPGLQQLASGGWPMASRRISEVIGRYARSNEKMVVWGWANSLHVETGLLLGTRFIPLYFPVIPGPEQAYFLAIYRRDLISNEPAIFVDAAALHPGNAYDQYPISQYPAIQSILDRHYKQVATVEKAKVYVRKSRLN